MEVSADDLGKHFPDLLVPPDWTLSLHFAMPWVKNYSLDGCVTGLEVENALAMLKERKAPGPDTIPSEFIKYATPQVKASLVTAFNKFLGSETVPKSFKKAINFPIFKKANPKVTSVYRGISFQNALAKVFSALLLERLKNSVKNYNILNEFQASFRKGYSIVDNIFSLTSIARSYIDSGKSYTRFL